MGPVTLIENRTGIISCPVLASPWPVVSWQRNSLPLVISGKVVDKYSKRMKLDANNRDLVITKVEMEDGGTYSCRAVNRIGSASGESEVTIGSKYFVVLFLPKFLSQQQSFYHHSKVFIITAKFF